MKPTIYDTVRTFLKKKTWKFGGEIETAVANIYGCKPSTVSRRLREMEEDKSLLARYVTVNTHRGNKDVVQYRLK